MFPLKEKRIRLGGWWSTDPALISDGYVQKIAETGCDFIMSSQLRDTEKINALLTCCDKYGVECVVFDERIYDNSDIDIGAITREYAHHPSYVGNMVKDEPGVTQFDHLRRVYDRFRAQTPGKDAYINLLPMYASTAQLEYGADVQAIEYYETKGTTYGEHLEAYCLKFDTPYICVDVYPCRTAEDGVTRTIYPGYLENLSQIASCCRKYDREMWIMVQDLVWYQPAREPDDTDLRWQFWTVLSFGVKAIFHYCLATPPGHTDGLLNAAGERSPLFYTAKGFHRFLKSLEDIYLSYRNTGAFTVNGREDLPHLQFAEQKTDFTPIREIRTESPLLVGCFEKEDGAAFTVVNMEPLSEGRTAKVSMTLQAGEATIYTDSMTVTLPLTDGKCEFTLPCGEGCFITLK